jgi:hypothetical protein
MDEAGRKKRNETVKRVNGFLRSLTINSNSLLTAFANIVDALNQEEWARVEKLLDENVQLTTLDPPTTFNGRKDVVKYISEKIADDHPVLIPLATVDSDAITGTVKGTALWEDNDNGKRTTSPITYKFIFVLHSDEKWYVVSLSGSPD